MQKNTFFKAILFLFLAFGNTIHAQMAIWDIDEMARLRKGTTYLVTEDTTSKTCKEYIEVIKQTWTLSPVKCIKPSEIETYLAPGSSFFSFTCVENTTTKTDRNGFVKQGNSTFTFYFDLWICDEGYFSKKRKRLKEDDKIQIARIELYTTHLSYINPEKFTSTKLDGGGNIRNWSPGIVKNYLQSVMYFIKKKEERALTRDIFQPKLLKKLKKDTLFIPDYVLLKMNPLTGKETERDDPEELMKEYPYPYKIVPMDELSQRILTDATGIHYLIYVRSVADKTISVMNSKSGVILSSLRTSLTYNIKSKDFKTLRQDIESD